VFLFIWLLFVVRSKMGYFPFSGVILLGDFGFAADFHALG